jgi:hypothetical protein
LIRIKSRLSREPTMAGMPRTSAQRLAAMLQRRGASLPPVADADTRAALARCVSCCAQRLCDELLASPGSGGYRAFCANTHYVESRRERQLKF